MPHIGVSEAPEKKARKTFVPSLCHTAGEVRATDTGAHRGPATRPNDCVLKAFSIPHSSPAKALAKKTWGKVTDLWIFQFKLGMLANTNQQIFSKEDCGGVTLVRCKPIELKGKIHPQAPIR